MFMALLLEVVDLSTCSIIFESGNTVRDTSTIQSK